MEGNIIDLFMWGYQQHTQSSFQGKADSLFKKIDYKLNPKVFFVGVLVDNIENRHPICLEPEDCGVHVSNFSDLKELASQLEKVDEESRIIHSLAIAQKNHEKRIATKSYIEGIKKILKRENIYGENEYFVASPTYIEGYLVFTILSLNKEKLNSFYVLTKDKMDDRFTIYRSFIESTISIFQKECTNALKEPDTSYNGIERPIDELFRLAGRQFMYTVSSAGKNFDGLHGLYDACNEIAAMKYEGTIGLGNIIVAPKDHKNIKMTLQLREPIKISDYRKVRKFLELSDNQSSIISDSALIYGLGELRGKYNPKEESVFVINFVNHFAWELSHDNNPLMLVAYREPSLPIEKINREKFYSDFPRLFKDITKEQIDDLWEISMEATKQKHGTMLVISDNAHNESQRLGKQCFPLKPLKLTDKIIQQITAIDGAVLLDRDATCYAIGVILDGIATEKGDASRGARFNSAIRYYENFGKDTSLVLVIISEDGMINLIPILKPQIKHSQITEAIEEFKTILENETLNFKAFNQGMSYFQSLNFYLNGSECSEINTARKEIEEKFKTDLMRMRIIYSDLIPNPEMNETYYKLE